MNPDVLAIRHAVAAINVIRCIGLKMILNALQHPCAVIGVKLRHPGTGVILQFKLFSDIVFATAE